MGITDYKKDLYKTLLSLEEKTGDIDLHVHSLGSSDGKYSHDGLVRRAQQLGLKYLSITDHNNLAYVLDFLSRNHLPKNMPYHELDLLKYVPGVEVTCRVNDSGGVNYKGNPAKVHFLVYAPILTKNIPFVKLMEAKHTNDIAYDFGTFIAVAKARDIELNEANVRMFIEKKRDQINGFTTMGKEDIWEYFCKYHSGVFKSRKSFFDACSEIPQSTRMNLDAKEIIDFVHDAGGICVMAHPSSSLNRISNREKIIDIILDYGIDGFEMNGPSMKNNDYDMIKSVCDRHSSKNKIIFTAGTDFHRIVGWRDEGRYDDIKTKKSIYLKSSEMPVFVKELERLKEAREYNSDTHRRYDDKLSRLELEDRVAKAVKFAEKNKYWDGSFPIFDSVIRAGIPDFEKQIAM